MKATTLDDAGRVRAAFADASDPEALVVQILAELKRTEPDVVRQVGGMGITGGRPVYPCSSPHSDDVVLGRLLDKHPEMVAGALRRRNERNET